MFSEITILLIKFPRRSQRAVHVLVPPFRECLVLGWVLALCDKVSRFVIFVIFFYFV